MMNNPKAIKCLSKDPKLKNIINQIDIGNNHGERQVYGSLLRSIISQQLSVKAADTIYKRFLELFDNNPSPQAILDKSIEELRSVGLSNQKAGYMQNIATFFNDKNLHEEDWASYSDEEVIQLLTQIKGVGVWTVQMILMFTLNREDVFPTADLGIQQAIQKLYKIDSTGKVLIQEMNRISEKWRPYRTFACLYLWRWKDQ